MKLKAKYYKKGTIIMGTCALLSMPSFSTSDFIVNPYINSTDKPIAYNEGYEDIDKDNICSFSYGEKANKDFCWKEGLAINNTQTEIKKNAKPNYEFQEMYNKYAFILESESENENELSKQLTQDEEKFYFYDFLLFFIKNAPAALGETFIDDLLDSDIDIFTRVYKTILVECSNLTPSTLARKAKNILDLYAKEFENI